MVDSGVRNPGMGHLSGHELETNDQNPGGTVLPGNRCTSTMTIDKEHMLDMFVGFLSSTIAAPFTTRRRSNGPCAGIAARMNLTGKDDVLVEENWR